MNNTELYNLIKRKVDPYEGTRLIRSISGYKVNDGMLRGQMLGRKTYLELLDILTEVAANCDFWDILQSLTVFDEMTIIMDR